MKKEKGVYCHWVNTELENVAPQCMSFTCKL